LRRFNRLVKRGRSRSVGTEGIAELEKLDERYVRRLVKLTSLAPEIVAAILKDSLSNKIMLFDLAMDPPALWEERRRRGRTWTI